jgi:hypothetical protein
MLIIKMGEDISRNIVVVMLVVAVLISLLGTWTIVSTINSITVTDSGQDLVTGRVSVQIAPNPEHPMNQVPAAEAKNSEGGK